MLIQHFPINPLLVYVVCIFAVVENWEEITFSLFLIKIKISYVIFIGDDCDTECRDLESASSLELNSQNCDECTDITDLNVGLQPEEEIDLCSDDENH